MTREEAIDCLEGTKIYLQMKHLDTEAIDMAIDALKAEPKTGEWIPCSERLPNEDETRKKCKHV